MDLQLLVSLLSVETDGLDGGDHHHHAECDRNKQHDYVFGTIFKCQFFIIWLQLWSLARFAISHCTCTVIPARPGLHQQNVTFRVIDN